MNTHDFQELVWQQGRDLYRDMPWRDITSPYFILVSELMLQQTQVERVIPKFNAFMEQFPDVSALASASLADVLTAWSGLGYNRRAKYLHQTAKKIMADFGGVIPSVREQLMSLPGVGPSTSAAILTYSFNQPVVFIETNIRTVYFHHFFADVPSVHDKELLDVVHQTLDNENPRQWYWALMDYGSLLKRVGVGGNSKSVHYKKQSPLEGSLRQVRGQIIRVLTGGDLTRQELRLELAGDERFEVALGDLIKEGLVSNTNQQLHLTK